MSKRYEPAFGGNPRVLIRPSGEKATMSDGTVPSDTAAGYEAGCIHQRKTSAGVFINDGSKTSADFNRVVTSTDDVALAATVAEVNRIAQASARVVGTTSTQITVSAASHGERDLVLNSTHTVTATLPATSGSGNRYYVLVGVTGTDGSKIVTVNSTSDVIAGGSLAVNTQSTTIGFQTTNATTITLNNTTTGGKIGSRIELVDVAAGTWLCNVFNITSGNPATPFS